MKHYRDIFTGIDLGTSSIKVVIAEFREDDTLIVLGAGERPSCRMLKGEPVGRPEVVAEALEGALEDALDAAELKRVPGRTSVVFSGSFIEPEIVHSEFPMPSDQPISEEIFEQALRNVYNNLPPEDDEHQPLPYVINRCFQLSDGRMLFDPRGQYSSSLKVETYFLLCDRDRYNTLLSILDNVIIGRRVDSLHYAPIAISSGVFEPVSAEAALPLVIEIGAGVTSFAMQTLVGHLVCEQLTVGCDHIANDLSIGLGLDIKTAQQLLRELNSLHCNGIATHDGTARMVTISHAGGDGASQLVPADAIETIIEARLTEIFEIVRQRLDELGALKWLGSEVLLSGGGALIPRICELAAGIFNRPVRVATAFQVVGPPEVAASPRFNSVLGLLRADQREALVSAQRQRTPWEYFVSLSRKSWQALTDW